jgi:hypothetical protein
MFTSFFNVIWLLGITDMAARALICMEPAGSSAKRWSDSGTTARFSRGTVGCRAEKDMGV